MAQSPEPEGPSGSKRSRSGTNSTVWANRKDCWGAGAGGQGNSDFEQLAPCACSASRQEARAVQAEVAAAAAVSRAAAAEARAVAAEASARRAETLAEDARKALADLQGRLCPFCKAYLLPPAE